MALVLRNALGFLQSSKLADFTVKWEGFEWKVHHVILASASTFFEKACGGNVQEATDKVITLHDDEPEMVARMLLCLYTSSYPSLFREGKPSESPSLRDFLLQGCVASEVDHFKYETNPLMVHSKMYAIAEKYDIPGLQAVFVTKFDLDRIPKRSLMKNLLVALTLVYTSTPPSANALRLKAAALVQKSYNDIMYSPKLKTQLESACARNE